MTTKRLHYLDWLRVLAILGVFLYHTMRPFDLTGWHIKNTELSYPLTGFMLAFAPWGMPFFFLVAGAGTRFALGHRTVRQYVTERFKRLFIPFIFGCLLLTPIMLYVEWLHKTQTGVFTASFLQFISNRTIPLSPEIFGWAGYHLWFLGFLFSYSLLALPMFLWLERPSGQMVVAGFARLCERRGGMLSAILPLLAIQLVFRTFFYEGEHNWTDFLFNLFFFVLGYMLYLDARFTQAIRRDWWITLSTAILTMLLAMGLIIFKDAFDWLSLPGTPGFYLLLTLIVINAWCWTLFMLFIGMRFLDFSNRWLEYGQEAILPFFLLHQPVIMVIAYFVVQWNTPILLKLLTVTSSSLLVTAGLYEFLIRHHGSLRLLSGMKPGHPDVINSAQSKLTRQ